MEIEHILGLRMFSIQGLACGLVPELHSQTKIELDSFILSAPYFINSIWPLALSNNRQQKSPNGAFPEDYGSLFCTTLLPNSRY